MTELEKLKQEIKAELLQELMADKTHSHNTEVAGRTFALQLDVMLDKAGYKGFENNRRKSALKNNIYGIVREALGLRNIVRLDPMDYQTAVDIAGQIIDIITATRKDKHHEN